MFLATGVGAFAAAAFHLMTHAFFKALLFLGSGSVIHGMAHEQDMRHMGGLKKYMPVTYVTMFIGTLAIAGIFPFSGFFSKDEILFRTFLANRLVWGLGVVAALMTAFYMFRLMSMTFLGTYRGPAWEGEGHGASSVAHHAPADDHGHGAWHGPHESPRLMTIPLQALAVGAVVAGFVGIPAALGGSNAIEHFLEPSFTARAVGDAGEREAESAAALAAEAVPAGAVGEPAADAADHGEEEAHMSRAGEIGLMALSVLVGLAGMWTAYRFYVLSPETPERLAASWSGAHRVLSDKYYVDELYDATAVQGTMAGARGLWAFDGRVVDGAVNGAGWVTVFSSWVSHLADKYIVDGLVNLVGWTTGESSFIVRWVQTGLVQNYALWMLAGVFALMTLYLIAR
jgi:NADH-quinone oxidoreductase subunit L